MDERSTTIADYTDYRAIFRASGDGLIVNDLDTGLVVEANPAACEMHGYTREEFLRLHPTQFIDPAFHDLFRDYIAALRRGEELRAVARDLRKDGSSFPVEVHGSRFLFNGRVHALGVVRDISGHEEANRLLEARVAERTRELALLLDVSRTVASTLEPEPLLDLIIETLRMVVPFTGATVLIREGDDLIVRADHGSTTGRHRSFVGLHIPLARGAALWAAIGSGEPVIIEDMHVPGPMSDAFRSAAGPLASGALSYVRAWLAVPMVVKGRVLGLITMADGSTGLYTARHAELALAVASQAAVAFENAQLFERAQRETRRTAALARIASRVALAGPLEPTLDALAQQVVQTSEARACALFVTETDLLAARLAGMHGLPPEYAQGIEQAMRCGDLTFTLAELQEARPLVRHNVWKTFLARPAFAHLQRFAGDVDWDMTVIVPLVAHGHKLGLMASYYHHDDDPDADELAYLAALANQAATAVQNALLLAQVQEKATMEERARLARDLHDSATQTVFSVGMLAEAARTQYERRSERVGATLDRVAGLAQQAHSEMRALLFELRPDAALEQGLAIGLERLLEAVRTRSGLPITLSGDDLPSLPPAQAMAVFRIVQEALNNVVKHAHAATVQVQVSRTEGGWTLRVTDDGAGFDPAARPEAERPGGLGMRSMRERALAAGCTLKLVSAPGAGTTVALTIPAL